MKRWRILGFGMIAALAASACQTAPETKEPPSGPAPEGCGSDFPAKAPLLKLEPTRAPASEPSGKGTPFRFANSIDVRRSLQREGLWTDFDDGWSSLALRVSSEGAKTLSLHFSQATLPPRTEVWLCSGDRRVRQGPYRQATGGELWTPVVPGSEALIEVILPTIEKRYLSAELTEVFGGYR